MMRNKAMKSSGKFSGKSSVGIWFGNRVNRTLKKISIEFFHITADLLWFYESQDKRNNTSC